MRLLAFLLAGLSLTAAEKYAGPKPVKADIPYLMHADTLIETEAVEARNETRMRRSATNTISSHHRKSLQELTNSCRLFRLGRYSHSNDADTPASVPDVIHSQEVLLMCHQPSLHILFLALNTWPRISVGRAVPSSNAWPHDISGTAFPQHFRCTVRHDRFREE